MHDALFADALRPERVTVLNLLMLDYSIGHELLLWRQRNPLVTLNRAGFDALAPAERRAAIMLAALVCYRDWERNQRREKHLWLWAWWTRKQQTGDEVEKFRAYRADGSSTLPTRDIPRTAGAPFHYFGSPEAALLLLFVRPIYADFGFETPFDFPLGLARQLYLADAETKGNVWVKNHHDMQEDQRADEFNRSQAGSSLAVGEDAVQASAESWNRDHPESPVPLMKAKKCQSL